MQTLPKFFQFSELGGSWAVMVHAGLLALRDEMEYGQKMLNFVYFAK